MHPAWEQACQDVGAAGHISSLKGPASSWSARSTSVEGHGLVTWSRSSSSTYSAKTCSSASSTGSHLSTLLPALGLGPLPEDLRKGQYSGEQCQDGGGLLKWPGQPGPSPSEAMSLASTGLTEDSAKTKQEESTNEWCVEDFAEGRGCSARASSAGKHRNEKMMAGASSGALRFHEPALPAKHEPLVVKL
mmetsp:Transcript_176866/g.567296  ORF Transcript_176866/g.567296 Transcript_176866/m.567296 type:complete len:190 (+) Transcript_176866:95-664(+)